VHRVNETAPSGEPPALVARAVSRSFGRVRALDRFEATFPSGKVSGLVGPNSLRLKLVDEKRSGTGIVMLTYVPEKG
jgi:ABC-type uncharacterized transport system ATPase subunit